MGLADLERRLREVLEGGNLPGPAAHLRLSPKPRPGWDPWQVPEGQRPAAALALFYPWEGQPHLLLTERSHALPDHPGQVALPGGAVEAGETIETAALREAQEEVGLDPVAVRVLGRLSPLHIPISGFVLCPVVGVTDVRPRFRPDPVEVHRVIEIPLDHFADASRIGFFRRNYQKTDLDIPFIDVDGARLWGATGMVMCELLELLDIRVDPWGAPER